MNIHKTYIRFEQSRHNQTHVRNFNKTNIYPLSFEKYGARDFKYHFKIQ